MKQKSIFEDIVNPLMKYASGVTVERTNGERVPPKYMYLSRLEEEYSPDLNWQSNVFANTVVRADYVAMDSPLPIKRRPSVGVVSGKLAKIGIKKWLSESELSAIQVMRAQNKSTEEIAKKVFSDLVSCRDGIYEALEYMYLKILCGEEILIPDEDNPALGIRVQFGVPTKNKLKVAKKWSDPTADTIADIRKVVDQASLDGNTIRKAYVSRKTYNQLRESAGVKKLHSVSSGVALDVVGVPTNSRFRSIFYDEFGFDLEIVDRSIRTEVNGVATSEKPFIDGVVSFVYGDKEGRLVYGQLAEEMMPVEGVKYEKAGSYILLSKYSMNEPLREYSSAQAIAMPVLDNADQMYFLYTEGVGRTVPDEIVTLGGTKIPLPILVEVLERQGHGDRLPDPITADGVLKCFPNHPNVIRALVHSSKALMEERGIKVE